MVHKALSKQITSRLTELVSRIISRLLLEVPLYARLPAEELYGEVSAIITHNVRLLGVLLREQRLAFSSELDRQRASARRRAEEGVPLDAVLEAYHLGTLVLWQDITSGVRDSALHDEYALLLGYLRQVTTAVSAEYMDARQSFLQSEHDARRSLITALLAGVALDNPALSLPSRYAVLVLAIGHHPDEADESVSATVAGRRKMRRVQDEFERFTEEPVLSALDPTGGIVLLTMQDWDKLRHLILAVGSAAGAPVIAGGGLASPADVPATVREATEVLELVQRLGYEPGLYRLGDVLLEYQLSRPSAARAGLAELLEPLNGKPDLLRTLQVYLRNELSRTRTAAELFVHPNTVDYRLRRIAQLTGLNPASPQDLPHLRAAILSR
ncbi:PucR family transcriptional regulator [Catelliglobosispora koreensis]|uniref:PucR family transcriptional regulator n=1 Tax=Catelliglobosispora koreensis TaxID=129052 RepID=UPI000363130E|nr:helix-turn-helix domain-containing protein [Catelliglobosispora koreensis]